MPACRLPASLLSTEWDATKCRGRPRKSRKRHLDELQSELELQDSVFDRKHIWSALKDREIREFELALQQKSKLRIYKVLKKDFGLEEYLNHVHGAHARLFFKFRSGTHGLFEELGRHTNRKGLQECTICGAPRESVKHVLFECPAYDSQ